MNIVSLFLKASKDYPNNIAIVENDQSINYETLSEEVKNTAAYFLKKGLKKGDRVLVFIPMSIDLYRVVLALFYIGATAVFLDEWVSKSRLILCCKMAECKGFIGGRKARIYSFFFRELRKIPIKLNSNKQLEGDIPVTIVEDETSALITFTTGSTGTPKAADRSHGFLKEQFEALLDEIGPKPSDIDMTTLPIVLFVNLGIGCTSVIADFKMSKPDKIDVNKISKQILSSGITRMTASPFFFEKLSENADTNGFVYDKIKKIFAGGAPVFPDEAENYVRSFPKAQVKIVYGSTEAEPISSIDGNDLANRSVELAKGLPVGRSYHKTGLKIIQINDKPLGPFSASEFNKMTLSDGNIGEIVVSGDHVLKRYFKNEKAFEENKIWVDDIMWHRTGDSGFLNNDELFLNGRVKQLIKHDSGFHSPFIIENKLQLIEGISKGTVLEFNSKILLVLESELSKKDLNKTIVGLTYDELVVLKKIPRDPRHNSKIDYGRLTKILSDVR